MNRAKASICQTIWAQVGSARGQMERVLDIYPPLSIFIAMVEVGISIVI